MPNLSDDIPGYSYGSAEVKSSRVSLADLELLKVSAGFTERDQEFLHLAGEVLVDHTEEIVHQWRSGISLAFPISPGIHGHLMEIQFPNIWRRAIFAFNSGSWIPVQGPTTRTG